MIVVVLRLALTTIWLIDAPEGATLPADPSALAVDAVGSVYVAGSQPSGIWKLDPSGTVEVVHLAEGPYGTPLRAIRALTIDEAGTLFAADSATGDVYRLRPEGPPEPLTAGALEVPTGLLVEPEGSILVCDQRLGRIVRLPNGGGVPEPIAEVAAPRGLARHPAGGIVVLSIREEALLHVKLDASEPPRALVLGHPFGLPNAILDDPESGGFLVSDGYAATIWMVSPEGAIQARYQGKPMVRPSALARDQTGALLIADPGAGQVFRAEESGALKPLLKGERP
ncbi:hypothetical protein BH23PLA1_BH23PLA1_07580 [soil metagenome]